MVVKMCIHCVHCRLLISFIHFVWRWKICDNKNVIIVNVRHAPCALSLSLSGREDMDTEKFSVSTWIICKIIKMWRRRKKKRRFWARLRRAHSKTTMNATWTMIRRKMQRELVAWNGETESLEFGVLGIIYISSGHFRICNQNSCRRNIDGAHRMTKRVLGESGKKEEKKNRKGIKTVRE